jgi:hypothetical protein
MTPYFGEYKAKKLYQTGTQTFSMISEGKFNIFLKNCYSFLIALM